MTALPALRSLTTQQVLDVDPALNFPTVSVAAYDGDKMISLGGLSWRFDRCWLWYRIIDRAGNIAHPHLLVGAARTMLRKAAGQFGETQVFAWRDASEPSSYRLLDVLGFKNLGFEPVEMVDGFTEEREVWVWPIQSHGLQSPRSAR